MTKIWILAGAIAAAAATAAAGAGTALVGTFALQGGVARTAAYLETTPGRFDFWLVPKNGGDALRDYDLDMTKFMHVIVVGRDFRTFLHVHPVLLPNGHFVLNETLPGPGAYYVYADAQPTGIGQQAFRFDVQAGKALPAGPKDLSERSAVAWVDGYSVTLSTLSLHAGSQTQIPVVIAKLGRPASDLHPYLGMIAHAVFLDADDLTYVHVHPVTLASKPPVNAVVYSNDRAIVPPNMLLHVTVAKPGTYKLWFQFRGGSSLHVASFVLTAAPK